MATDNIVRKFDHLLALDEARSQGQIVAVNNALRLGNYAVQGFRRHADALFLAKAANAVPRLVRELAAAYLTIQRKDEELSAQRKELLKLRRRLARVEARPNGAEFRPVAQMIDETSWHDFRHDVTYQLTAIYVDPVLAK